MTSQVRNLYAVIADFAAIYLNARHGAARNAEHDLDGASPLDGIAFQRIGWVLEDI